MAEKINATCSICGKGYYKCLSCKDKMAASPWKMYCCSSEHYKAYQVLHGFNVGVYTKDEAKEKLQSINLSDLSEFRDSVKKLIKSILKEDVKDVVIKPIAEESVEPVKSELIDNSFAGRKRKYTVQEPVSVESAQDVSKEEISE